MGGEFFEDGLLFLCIVPSGEEVIQRGVGLEESLAGVVLVRLGDELAIGIEVLDALGGDADFDVVDVVFGGRLAVRAIPTR